MGPSAPGALVGRAAERSAVEALLAERRKAWLSGLGGVGKTRLAREIFAASPGAWVDLAGVADQAALGVALAGEVGFPSDARPTPSALAAWCAGRGLPLLVLDDADRVAESTRAWVEVLSARVPVLVTARTAIEGGWGLPLGPLDPVAEGTALFLARVPERRVEEEIDAERVRALVERLGGLPLAIELAAARLAVVPLERLREGLDRSLALLRDPAGRDRGRSVESTLRWSWDRLDADEAALLAAAGVFDGPVPSAGVAAVAGREADDVLDALHRLVRLHLLEPARGAAGVEPRFELHALIRRFARERLRERGEEAAAERAHARWVGDRARALRAELGTAATASTIAAVRAEQRELAAVLGRADRVDPADAIEAGLLSLVAGDRWSEGHDRALVAGEAAATTGWHLLLARRFARRVRRRELDLALADAELGARRSATADEEALWRGRHAAARLVDAPDDADAAAELDRWIAVAREPLALGALRLLRAIYVHVPRGDHAEALADKEAHLAVLDPGDVAHARMLDSCAASLMMVGRAEEAVARMTEALARFEATGLEAHAGEVVGRLAGWWFMRGDLPRAAGLYERALANARALDDRPNVAHHGVGSALLAIEQGRGGTALLAGIDERWIQRSWTQTRATLHAVRALLAHDAGAPPPEPPDLAPDAVSGALVRDLAAALATLSAIEARLDGEREGTAEAIEGLRAELAAWPDTWDARRVVQRILRARLDACRARLDAWRVAADGTRFAAPGQPWVDLGHRPTLARTVAALLDGRVWTIAALGEEVWPGERMVGDSLRNRVQVAVSTLRKLGFALVVTTDGGYGLDPAAPLERVP